MQVNRSNPAYIATVNAAVLHKQNAERLSRLAADSRYPAHQRQTFADSASEECAMARQAASDASYYMDNGFMPIRKVATGTRIDIAA